MFKKSMLALAAAIVLPSAANAEVVLIDFNEFTENTLVTTEIAGLTITSEENGAANAVGAGVGPYWEDANPALWNTIVTTTEQSSVNHPDILTIAFDGLVSNLSFDHNGYGDNTVLRIFDEFDNMLDEIVASGALQNISFADSGIAYLQALQEVDSFTYSIDNLQFETSDVPEPAVLGLLGLGLAGFGAARRRRMK